MWTESGCAQRLVHRGARNRGTGQRVHRGDAPGVRRPVGTVRPRAGSAGEPIRRDGQPAYLDQANINHYPPVSVVGEPSPQFRIGLHTDFGTVTVLDREPGAGGLQVYSEQAGWEDAPWEPGLLTVNIGDLLEYWSGRRCRAGTGAAAAAGGAGRGSVSLIYF